MVAPVWFFWIIRTVFFPPDANPYVWLEQSSLLRVYFIFLLGVMSESAFRDLRLRPWP